jgi:hypothetical protein
MQIKVKWKLAFLSSGASPLLPYSCCSIPFKSAHALLLHPRLFLPPQEPKLLACASLAIFSYCLSRLRGRFTTSLLYLATIRSYCPSGLRGSFTMSSLYLVIVRNYYPSGLRGSFMTSSLYLATIHSYCPSILKGSFILPLLYVIMNNYSFDNIIVDWL